MVQTTMKLKRWFHEVGTNPKWRPNNNLNRKMVLYVIAARPQISEREVATHYLNYNTRQTFRKCHFEMDFMQGKNNYQVKLD